MSLFTYRKADITHIEYLCNYNIAQHPGDDRWLTWMKEAADNFKADRTAVFVVCCNEIPVGEMTLILDPVCSAVAGRTALAEYGKTANVNALRIRKEYEGQGHISKLMKMAESYIRDLGYRQLTIGVEAKETRNLGIYLHWGYMEYVMSEGEGSELILYYRKSL